MAPPKTRRCGSAASTSLASDTPETLARPDLMNTITVHLQDSRGAVHTLQGRVGKSLMKEAVSGGVEAIAADCGGSMSCATCHVMVDLVWRDRLPPPDKDELAMLDMTAEPREAGSRLSCQIVLTPGLDGLRVRLPATQY